MTNEICLEIAVDHIESAIIAENAGADRIELCQALELGGLTPCAGLIMLAKKKLKIPIFVMIRPRSGNFFYTDDECVQMVKDIQFLLALEVDGFVTGALRKSENGIQVDKDICRKLIVAAKGKPVTFHRAFDLMTCDLSIALTDIIELGFTRILTSGRATIALEGLALIKDLIQMANSRIIIMPDETGSGLSGSNVKELYKGTKAKEFHSSGTTYLKMEPEESVAPIVAGTTYYKTVNFYIVETLRALLQEAKDEDV